MPSKSRSQYKYFKFMENHPEEAKKKGISEDLAKEYTDSMTKDRWKKLKDHLNKKK